MGISGMKSSKFDDHKFLIANDQYSRYRDEYDLILLTCFSIKHHLNNLKTTARTNLSLSLSFPNIEEKKKSLRSHHNNKNK